MGPPIVRARPESDAWISSGLCKCLFFMYVSVRVNKVVCMLTGVITKCTANTMAATKVEENFIIRD